MCGLCVLVRFLNKEKLDAVCTLQTVFDREAACPLSPHCLIAHPHRSCLSPGCGQRCSRVSVYQTYRAPSEAGVSGGFSPRSRSAPTVPDGLQAPPFG